MYWIRMSPLSEVHEPEKINHWFVTNIRDPIKLIIAKNPKKEQLIILPT